MTIIAGISRSSGNAHSAEITCPHCKAPFLLTDALRLPIEEDILRHERERHTQELQEAQARTEEQTRIQLEERFAVELTTAREDALEQRTLNKELRAALVELNKSMRTLTNERDAEKLLVERTLALREVEIRTDEQERVVEANRLKHLETEKKLKDALTAVEGMKIKLEQGSQQTQGDVLELDLEAQLRQLFPSDIITDVKTGIRGADIRQVVATQLGATCGVILWETKNARWNPAWLTKLRADMRDAGAEFAILVATNVPNDSAPMHQVDESVWVVQPRFAGPLARVLRQSLVRLNASQLLYADRAELLQAHHAYISGPGFRHRIDAILESYTALQGDLEAEKRYTMKRWARQETYIRGMIDNVEGLDGDLDGLQALCGPAEGTVITGGALGSPRLLAPSA